MTVEKFWCLYNFCFITINWVVVVKKSATSSNKILDEYIWGRGIDTMIKDAENSLKKFLYYSRLAVEKGFITKLEISAMEKTIINAINDLKSRKIPIKTFESLVSTLKGKIDELSQQLNI